MDYIEIIKKCELSRVDVLLKRIEDSLEEIHRLAQEEDMRAYVFLVSMIDYCKCKDYDKKLISRLSDMAAFISLHFFNYIEGMIKLSYFHQMEAIKNDPENEEYKKTFRNFYCGHPDADHDIEFEKEILKENTER